MEPLLFDRHFHQLFSRGQLDDAMRAKLCQQGGVDYLRSTYQLYHMALPVPMSSLDEYQRSFGHCYYRLTDQLSDLPASESHRLFNTVYALVLLQNKHGLEILKVRCRPTFTDIFERGLLAGLEFLRAGTTLTPVIYESLLTETIDDAITDNNAALYEQLMKLLPPRMENRHRLTELIEAAASKRLPLNDLLHKVELHGRELVDKVTFELLLNCDLRHQEALFEKLAGYGEHYRLPLWPYFSRTSVAQVQALLARLGHSWGIKVVVKAMSEALSSIFGSCHSEQVLELALNFVPEEQRSPPLNVCRTPTPEALEVLSRRYPRMAFELFLEFKPSKELFDRGLNVWRQAAGLLRRLATEILTHGRPGLLTQLELELECPQTRHSMLLWLQKHFVCEEPFRYDLRYFGPWQISAERVVSAFQAALHEDSQSRPWLLLMLGFEDPVPSSLYWSVNCARFLAAYGEAPQLARFISQLEPDMPDRKTVLYMAFCSAINYGRMAAALLLAHCVTWDADRLFKLKMQAREIQRPEMVALVASLE